MLTLDGGGVTLRQNSILAVGEEKIRFACASFETTQYLAYGPYLPTDYV